MIRFASIALLFFLSLSTKAQQVDSLYALLQTGEDKPSVDSLINLATAHPEEIEKLAKEALLLSNKIGYLKGTARAMELLGDFEFVNRNFEKALDFYQKSNEFFIRLKDTQGQLRTLKGLHLSAFNLKRYDIAIDYCLQIQHLAQKIDNKSFLAYAYSRLGRIKGEIMRDQKASREYSFKAIDLYFDIDDKAQLSSTYANIGISYYIDQQYDSSMMYLNKSIVIGNEFDLKQELHIAYSMSSELYYQNDNFDKALECSKKALSISLNGDREDIIAFDNLLIGKIYIAKEQYDTALIYVNIGIEIAKALDKQEYIATGYGHLSKIYKGKKEPLKSIEYLELASDLKDTIAKNSFSLRLAERESDFQMQMKQQELQMLEKSSYQQRLLRNGLIIISVLVIFILGLFINRYNVVMNFQKKELDRLRTIKQLEEKEKLLLKEKLSHQEKLLASNTMHIIQKNQILSDLKSEIKKLPSTESPNNFKSKIKNINRAIETNMTYENDWQNFKLQFEQVHSKFFSKLSKNFSNLSDNEIRFCAYIKMGHNTKEIAQLMGVNASSVQKARYRLKKKMELGQSINLIDFIKTL